MDALRLGDVFYYCPNWKDPLALHTIALCRVYDVNISKDEIAIEWFWSGDSYEKGSLLTGYDIPNCRPAPEEQWLMTRMKNYYDGKVLNNGS